MPDLSFVCVIKFWTRPQQHRLYTDKKEYNLTASKVYDTVLQLNQKFPTQ